MYFDDIFKGFEVVGENLAIKEFNEKHIGNIAISPEGTAKGWEGSFLGYPLYEWKADIKLCHYFNHPLYDEFCPPPFEAERPLRHFIL